MPTTECATLASSATSHNHIANTAYTGIIVAGSTGGVDDTHGNHILGKVVEDVLQRSGDGGGIYGVQSHGTSLEDGLLEEGNVVRNAREGTLAFALYTDLVSTYTTLRRNVAYGFRISLGGCNLPSTDWVFADGNYLETPDWLGSPVWFPCGGPLNHVTIQNTTEIDDPTPADACAAISECAAIVADAGLGAARRGLMAGRYGFDDVPAAENVTGPDFPVTRVHQGFDLGVGQWLASYQRDGYATTTHARFASAEGTSRTIGLKPGLRLGSITIEGPGRYTLSDGVNRTRSGRLRGAGRPVTVTTGWTRPGATVTITLTAGQATVVDDLVANG